MYRELLSKYNEITDEDGYYNDEVHTMELGSKILELRHSAGWTRSHLARLIGTNCRTIENWENDISMPSIENLCKICRVFHTTPNTILGFNTNTHLILDGLPIEDQIIIRGIIQLFWDKK